MPRLTNDQTLAALDSALLDLDSRHFPYSSTAIPAEDAVFELQRIQAFAQTVIAREMLLQGGRR